MALPKGLDSPFRLVSERNSPNVVEGDECLDRSIRTIIRTFPGERVYRPTFGSFARAGVFANMTEASALQIAADIRRAVATWEQRVTIRDITFELTDSTINLIIIWQASGRDRDSTSIIEFRI